MTKHESFKRRIRARMAKTGERYGAARRVLIDQSTDSTADRLPSEVAVRQRAAEPEMSDEAVRAATGRAWDEWCDLIDAWPGRSEGHAAIAGYLESEHAVDGWWAQTVTVGYERITGRRLPHQSPDGTFNVNRSRTVSVDGGALRSWLLEDDDRADLLPGLATELRSRPTSKGIRIAIGSGVALISIGEASGGRTKVTVQHQRLASPSEVEDWQGYWSEWLSALDEG